MKTFRNIIDHDENKISLIRKVIEANRCRLDFRLKGGKPRNTGAAKTYRVLLLMARGKTRRDIARITGVSFNAMGHIKNRLLLDASLMGIDFS